MDLRKPKVGLSKLQEMQDKLKEKNLKTLERIAENIDFDNVSCDPTKAALWVAKAVETFAVEVPVLSERGTSNGLSRSQTPSSKSARETEEDDIDLSKMMIDNREERIEDVVRSAISSQRRRELDTRALQMFGKSSRLPSKKKWIRQQSEALEKELNQKFARANFNAVNSFQKLSDALFLTPGEFKGVPEITQRNEFGNILLKVLCGASQPSDSESAATLKSSLSNDNKSHSPLLEAFKVLAGSKSVMGQVLSVYKYIADQDSTIEISSSLSNAVSMPTSTATDKPSRLPSREHDETSFESSDSPDTQDNEDKNQKIATQQGYYIEATKILIEMSNRDFGVPQYISYGGPPLFTTHPYTGAPIFAPYAPHPSPGPNSYSSPYARKPMPPQDTSHSIPNMIYDSPYTDSGANVDPNSGVVSSTTTDNVASTQDAMIPTNQPEIHVISSDESKGKSTRRKKVNASSKRTSKRTGRNAGRAPFNSSCSEQEIEAQKDMFEKTGKLYPQTLSQIDALLTMANGGILPGPPSSESSMDIDNDATESENGPETSAETQGQEGAEDKAIMSIVDHIVDDLMELRDWQGMLPPGTHQEAMSQSERGLFLMSELKRLVTLARPLVNVVVPEETGSAISIFYHHLSACASPRALFPQPVFAPAPAPFVLRSNDMAPPPTPQKAKAGEKRKRK